MHLFTSVFYLYLFTHLFYKYLVTCVFYKYFFACVFYMHLFTHVFISNYLHMYFTYIYFLVFEHGICLTIAKFVDARTICESAISLKIINQGNTIQ